MLKITRKYYSSVKCLHVCLWKGFFIHACVYVREMKGKKPRCRCVQVSLRECVYFYEMKCEGMMGWRVDERGGRRKERSTPVALGASLPWGPSDCSVTIHRRLTLPLSARPCACSSTRWMFNTYTGRIFRMPREKCSTQAVREKVFISL